MGLTTMVIFFSALTMLVAWARQGVLQSSCVDVIIPVGLGVGVCIILIAEIEESPTQFIMAATVMLMAYMMAFTTIGIMYPTFW